MYWKLLNSPAGLALNGKCVFLRKTTIMKRILFLSFLLGSGLHVAAQNIEVRESNERIGDGSHNALVVNIPVNDKKAVEKAWVSKMKGMDAKKVSSKKEIFADDAKHRDMGPNTFDVYARVEQDGKNGVRLVVAVDLGGAYLSSSQHPDQFRAFRNEVYNFAVEATKSNIGGDLKAQEKALVKLESDQKKLEKENKKLQDNIESNKKKISNDEKTLKKNEDEQNKKKNEIETQRKLVNDVKERMGKVK